MSELENFSLEDGWKVGEWWEWVSEAAMWIVTENLKKSKKVQAQIQKQSAHNNDLAIMLWMLLNKVSDDNLIKKVVMLISEDVDIVEIFSLFVPFCKNEVSQNPKIMEHFPSIISVDSLSWYSDYIHKNLKSSNSLKNIEKSFFISIIYDIALYFDIGNISDSIQKDPLIKQKIMDWLKKDIYNLSELI